MRRLAAALACRADGSRLYGKPLQNLDAEKGVTILDHLIHLIRTLDCIEAIVLGISEGSANAVFTEVAGRHGIDYIVGDRKDVLQRLIDCGRHAEATDVFRVTTESPFFYWELVDEAWRAHLARSSDVTTIDGVPDGCHFEIYTLEALERSHREGGLRHRSEYCNLYVREHRSEFRVDVLSIPLQVERPDLRLTVDNPEDLVLCRRVYGEFKGKAPRLPLLEIVEFVDSHPELRALVAPYVFPGRMW